MSSLTTRDATAFEVERAMSGTMSNLIDALVDIDASLSTLAAARAELLESIRSWSSITEAANERSTPHSRDLAFRSVRAEVACALRLPERTVENLFGEARMLVRELPAATQALRSGEITYRHAQVIIDHAADLEGEQRARFERLAVPIAATSTVSSLERQARRLRESINADTILERTRAAVERREVTWSPGRDGMGWLSLYLPVADGLAIHSRATDAARKLRDLERPTAPTPPRTLAQLRLDVMRDALMSGPFEALGGSLVHPDVHVTVPVFSLMGATDEPATLDGYGPIDAETARQLAAHAPTFVRVLIHPHTGAVLSYDRERYSTPADLRAVLRSRDVTCGFFGCSQAADRCDLDHTRDWQYGGTTELANLAHLCRGHHTLKHHTRWSVIQAADGSGTLTWTSPAGKKYRRVPERGQPPQIPPY